MRTLTPAARRAFRAKAHPLHPFVTIGHHGLTPAVLHETFKKYFPADRYTVVTLVPEKPGP